MSGGTLVGALRGSPSKVNWTSAVPPPNVSDDLELLMNWIACLKEGVRLNLSGAGVKKLPCGQESLKKIATSILSNGCIRSLNFNSRKIGDGGVEAVIDNLVMRTNRIAELILYGVGMSDGGLASIGRALRRNHIVRLSVGANNFSGKAIETFCNDMAKSRSLSSVVLSNLRLNAESVPHLKQAFTQNCAIVEVKLSSNQDLAKLDIEELENCVRGNLQGTNLLIQHVEEGDLDLIEQDLRNGYQPHVLGTKNYSALHAAVKLNRADALDILLNSAVIIEPLDSSGKLPADYLTDKTDSKVRDLLKSKSPYDITPRQFVCPITHLVMLDPVVLPSGYSCERSAAEKLEKDPFTQEPILQKTFPLNRQLKELILAHLEQNPTVNRILYKPVPSIDLCMQAIGQENERQLRSLLERDPGLLNRRDSSGVDIITRACESTEAIFGLVIGMIKPSSKNVFTYGHFVSLAKHVGPNGLAAFVERFGPVDKRILHQSLTKADVDLLRVLVSMEDVNQCINGCPLLHIAVCGGIPSDCEPTLSEEKRLPCVKLLLDNGVNSDLVYQNTTAEKLAEEKGWKTIAEMLKKRRLGREFKSVLSPLEDRISTGESKLGALESRMEVLGRVMRLMLGALQCGSGIETVASDLQACCQEFEAKSQTGDPDQESVGALKLPVFQNISSKDAEFIRGNGHIELVNDGFQRLDDLKIRIKNKELNPADPLDVIIIQYCAFKTLMRIFHLLGVINSKSEFREHNLPYLVSIESDDRQTASWLRNQLMHYLFRFQGNQTLFIDTIKELDPLAKAVSDLKKYGQLPTDFTPFDLRQLKIYQHAQAYRKGDSDRTVADRDQALKDLALFHTQLRDLHRFCKVARGKDQGFWERNSVYQTAVEGLLVAIGQRHRDLKAHHNSTYKAIERTYCAADLYQTVKIGKFSITGTVPEILRAKFGHMFGEDGENPDQPTIEKDLRVALEPVPSNHLEEWLKKISELDIELRDLQVPPSS